MILYCKNNKDTVTLTLGKKYEGILLGEQPFSSGFVHTNTLQNAKLFVCVGNDGIKRSYDADRFQAQPVNISNKLKELEDKIEKAVGPIRVLGLLRKRKETIEEFIVKFLTKFNEEKVTVYLTGEVQTDKRRRRSIGDIYMICKYYYPTITLKQVKTILMEKLAGVEDHFRSSYCHTEKKRMYYYSINESKGVYDKTQKDEYGLIWNNWLEL